MERWYWIELIGFDNEARDYGVEAFLSRNVSTHGVSILFSHIDFIFDESEQLSPTSCSYCGHEYNRERRRQNWTVTQLRGLIDELHSRGIKVFFSSFDMTRNITDPSWLCYNSFGAAEKLVYVIKRNDAGKLVGDEVIERIKATLDKYGFDGLHLADGLSSNRMSIENGDFSLSLCKEAPLNIPSSLMKDCPDAYVKRRKWILKNAKYEWIKFISERWADFYRRLYDVIKKPVIFNNAWTRDTFEALYRYGLDYTKCGVDKAHAIMIEENSASRAIMAPEDEAGVIHTVEERDGFTYTYALMQQNIRIVTDGLKQIALCPISDTMEQWDAIRHCPTELSRAIVRRYNNYVYRMGKFEVCSDAPLYCLSDGIAKSDWKWLSEQEGYRIPAPEYIDGFVAVCNPKAIRADVELYCKEKHYYGSALLGELYSSGMSIAAQAPIDELKSFDKSKCLVITDLKAYGKEEKELLAAVKTPMLIIGEDTELSIPASAKYTGKYVSVALYNLNESVSLDSLGQFDREVRAGVARHGEIWTETLSYKRMCPKFFDELYRTVTDALRIPKSLIKEVKTVSIDTMNEKYVILSNDRYTYTLATVDMGKSVTDATAIMKYTGYRVKINGTRFTVRIPPRSVEIVKIEVE